MIVLGGIWVGQFTLFSPSLTGKKILLPLDILAQQSVYLPGSPKIPHDSMRADLVVIAEPARQFAVAEFHAGRIPMWNPYQYAGCPVVSPKFSPFLLLAYTTPSPIILAWIQLFGATVGGLGLFVFFRRTLRVGFWPAAISAWCYPVMGFFVFWQGYALSYPVFLLPWLLLAVDRTIRGSGRLAPIGLSLVTGLVLVSGALDVAGLVLMVSGGYAVWCIGDTYWQKWLGKKALRVTALLTTAWVLGFLLAAPFILPLLEYAHTGARMERRSVGSEERPPVGWPALPQTVLPDMNGTTQTGSLRISEDNQMESSAAAYAGLLATLFIAPLAGCSRRHRSVNCFWLLLGFVGLGWCLNVPVWVALLRLPGLNMMSYNRLVFATSLAVLALAAVGLDALWQHKVRRRLWFLLPVVILTGLFSWCCYRSSFLPDSIATNLESVIAHNQSVGWIHDLDAVRQVQGWFSASFKFSAFLCGLGLIGWMLIGLRSRWPQWAVPVLGILMVADLLWFAHDRSAQCDPALYYPRLPVLEKLSQLEPGRVIAVDCLPAALTQTHRLHDLRGYDAIDPACLMDLMSLAAAPTFRPPPYALTQLFLPQGTMTSNEIHLPPVLDMLGVRYVIFRGVPPAGIQPLLQSPDYWVMKNHHALDRVFVPRNIETVAFASEQLHKLASEQFNPNEVAYVEQPVNLKGIAVGRAEIINELPVRATIAAHMTTSGLVVMADLWDVGWKAFLNGQPAPILRVNHAIRGVMVSAGENTLEFRYEPASYRHGLELAGFAAAILSIWHLWPQVFAWPVKKIRQAIRLRLGGEN